MLAAECPGTFWFLHLQTNQSENRHGPVGVDALARGNLGKWFSRIKDAGIWCCLLFYLFPQTIVARQLFSHRTMCGDNQNNNSRKEPGSFSPREFRCGLFPLTQQFISRVYLSHSVSFVHYTHAGCLVLRHHASGDYGTHREVHA